MAEVLCRLWAEVRELSFGTSGQLDRLNSAPSPLQFLRNHVSTNRPCIISRSATAHWPAIAHSLWTDDDYLCGTLNSQSVSVHLTPNGRADSLVPLPRSDSRSVPGSEEFCFATSYVQSMRFPEALRMISTAGMSVPRPSSPSSSGVVAYAQQQNDCFREEYSALSADVEPHIPWATEAFGSLPEAVNLWIGSFRSQTSFHKDHYENLYVVITGEKHFLLLPPTDLHRLYIRSYPAARYIISPENGELTLELEKPERRVPWCSVDPFPSSPEVMARQMDSFPLPAAGACFTGSPSDLVLHENCSAACFTHFTKEVFHAFRCNSLTPFVRNKVPKRLEKDSEDNILRSAMLKTMARRKTSAIRESAGKGPGSANSSPFHVGMPCRKESIDILENALTERIIQINELQAQNLVLLRNQEVGQTPTVLLKQTGLSQPGVLSASTKHSCHKTYGIEKKNSPIQVVRQLPKDQTKSQKLAIFVICQAMKVPYTKSSDARKFTTQLLRSKGRDEHHALIDSNLFYKCWPFSPVVLVHPTPSGFEFLYIEKFDETSDSLMHVRHYVAIMHIRGAADELLCQVFPVTLKGQARAWFHSLDEGMINNFEELAHLFVNQFAFNGNKKIASKESSKQQVKKRKHENSPRPEPKRRCGHRTDV
ncbi:hypothetical protein KSP39_PZI024508 [Platanthera zijinensis]|uniref:JmjC domain-containing protein n=1 Tax=Platanthera zijinensis TaxID=2320716 RepID=A0AAP0FTW9_9ASPA